MPAPALPFWMRQRQIKAEPVGESAVKLTAPNLPAHELVLEGSPPHWKAKLHRVNTEGAREPLAELEFDVPLADQAWQNAYELYRQQVII